MTLPSGAIELGTRAATGAATIPGLIGLRADEAPGAVAIVAPGGEAISYGALRQRIAAVATRLAGLGVEREDRIATVVANGPAAAVSFLGVASVATCAPLNPAYPAAEVEFFLRDLEARILLTDGSAAEARAAAERLGVQVLELEPGLDGGDGGPDPAPGDVALVLHTSGTTSRPKLVPLTHRNLCASARGIAATLDLTPDDRCLNVMPLFHIHGLVASLLASLSAGASVACSPGFHAPSFFGWLEELEPTWYTAVPTMHQAILARAGARAAPRLRFVRSSSAPLPPAVLDGLERTFGVPAIEAYGMTEAAHQMASNPLPPGERKPGSVGVAAGPEVCVLNDAGEPVPSGGTGEIAVRGESVFSGYTGDREATERAFTDGWFRTGDEGYLDDDGYLFIRGRLKELINRGGEKIAPREVDEALLAHPAVGQAVAFAMPDPRLGEEVAAAVVRRDDSSVSERALQEFVAARLADFKVPRRIVFVDEIPRGPTGKLQRIGLAETLRVTAPPPARRDPYVEPRTTLERELAALFAEVLHVRQVGATDDFFRLGGDSLLGSELVARLRERHGRTDLLPSVLLWAPTVETLAAELGGMPEREKWSPLVPLQAQGPGTPLFFVHGLDGGVMALVELARALGEDRPFYGLRARGIGGGGRPLKRVEDMARLHLRAIRRVQPHGPYLLGGLCAGATIALELAQRLRAAGEEVRLVVLADPRCATEIPAPPRRERPVAWARLRLGRLRRAALKRLRAPRPTPAEAAELTQKRVLELLWNARDDYLPAAYDGRLLVFGSAEPPTPPSFWHAIAPKLEWVDSPVPHDDLIGRTNAPRVANVLRARLAELAL